MLRRLFASVVRPPYVWLRNGITDLLFERRLGVRTSGDVELQELGIAADGRVKYRPVGWLTLRRILPPSAVTTDDVFLDIGSGMGRAVLLAAAYPFRRVIGDSRAPNPMLHGRGPAAGSSTGPRPARSCA